MLGRINCKKCKKIIAINKSDDLYPLPHAKVETISKSEVVLICKCKYKNSIKIK